MKAIISRDDYVLTVERPVIEVRSFGHHEIDPKWSHADSHGHVHVSLDTLEWVVTGTYWCESCRDEHDEGEYRCRVCGDVVEPAFRWVDTSQRPEYIPGLAEATLAMKDGRTFLLRPDEMPETDASGTPTAAWLERVTSRQPDAWNVTIA